MARYTATQLAAQAVAAKADMVVITGGEPAIHDLRPLIQALQYERIRVHIETSGAFPVPNTLEWVTVSPKEQYLPTVDTLLLADELKFIISCPEDVVTWSAWLQTNAHVFSRLSCVWLHPEWGMRNDESVLRSITEAVLRPPVAEGLPRFRAGWQIHKMYLCDEADNRTRPTVPLGGVPLHRTI
jgi:organic radical activating enzyme